MYVCMPVVVVIGGCVAHASAYLEKPDLVSMYVIGGDP